MAPPAVRFHPAAAQEVESTYEWYAARDVSAAHGFVRNYAKQSTSSLRVCTLGLATVDTHAGTCFLAILSVSSTSFATISLKSSPSRTVGGGPGTGGHDSETPSNRPLERPGVNATRQAGVAGAGRSAPSR